MEVMTLQIKLFKSVEKKRGYARLKYKTPTWAMILKHFRISSSDGG